MGGRPLGGPTAPAHAAVAALRRQVLGEAPRRVRRPRPGSPGSSVDAAPVPQPRAAAGALGARLGGGATRQVARHGRPSAGLALVQLGGRLRPASLAAVARHRWAHLKPLPWARLEVTGAKFGRKKFQSRALASAALGSSRLVSRMHPPPRRQPVPPPGTRSPPWGQGPSTDWRRVTPTASTGPGTRFHSSSLVKDAPCHQVQQGSRVRPAAWQRRSWGHLALGDGVEAVTGLPVLRGQRDPINVGPAGGSPPSPASGLHWAGPQDLRFSSDSQDSPRLTPSPVLKDASRVPGLARSSPASSRPRPLPQLPAPSPTAPSLQGHCPPAASPGP